MAASQRTETCDVAVIGAGTAGLVAEKTARDHGASTRLIDEAFAGTTCASVGCMPSKLLIAAADAAQAVRDAAQFGIDATPRVDGIAVQSRLRRYRDTFVKGVTDSFARLPAGTCLQGRARFIAPGQLELDDGTRIKARAVVVATGSRPMLPKAFQAVEQRILTNQNIFELEDLPASVGVIGSGPIGLELAQALARLGVRVAVFDRGDRLAGLPARVSAELHRILATELSIHLGQSPRAEYANNQRDSVRLVWDGGAAQFDWLLVAHRNWMHWPWTKPACGWTPTACRTLTPPPSSVPAHRSSSLAMPTTCIRCCTKPRTTARLLDATPPAIRSCAGRVAPSRSPSLSAGR